MTALYWLRNDLRLEDNQILEKFSQEKEGIFLTIDSRSFKRSQVKRKDFFESELGHLAFELEDYEQKIFHSKEPLLFTLEKIHAYSPIKRIYFSNEYATEEKEDENQLIHFCLHHQIKIVSDYQQTLIHVNDLPFSSPSELPFIFTEFRKKVESNLIIRKELSSPLLLPKLYDISSLYPSIEAKPKVETGLNRIKYYFFDTHKVKEYKHTRNGLIHYDDSTKVDRKD